MKKLIGRFAAITVVAAMFAACDSSAPDQMMVPNADELVAGSGKVADTKNVRASNRVEGVIGTEGGSISAGGHTLTVPAGAVVEPTRFIMHIVEANKVHVKLRAYRMSDGAAVTQFRNVPVQIKLNVADVVDTNGYLTVAYLQDGTYDGRKEIQPSVHDAANGTLTGWLVHFSDYSVYLDLKPPPAPPTGDLGGLL